MSSSEERESWDSVAAAWQKWWHHFEAAAQPLNDRLVELAGVEPGAHVLDVGTGLGEPALTAARRVGPKGRVIATDFAEQMLAHARERARGAGLTNTEFVQREAENLGFEQDCFDAALSRWGVMLFVDPAQALRGIRASLKPGARLALAVWAPPDDVPFLALPRRAAGRVIELPQLPPPGLAEPPGPFRLADKELLRRLLTDCGFVDARIESQKVVFRFDSPTRFAEFVRDLSSSMRKTLAQHPESVRTDVYSEIAREVAPLVSPDGRLQLTNVTYCAVGAAG